MKSNWFYLFILLMTSSCASSNWALRKASDRSFIAYTFPDSVNRSAIMANWLVIDLKKTAEPQDYAYKYPAQQILCLDRKKDFDGSPMARLDGGQVKSRICLEGLTSDKLPLLNETPDLSGWFLLPGLGVGVDYYSFWGGGSVFCESCKDLSKYHGQVIGAYKVSVQRFYLKLKSGSYLRFSRKIKSGYKDYVPELVAEKIFLEEKNKPKQIKFVSIKKGHYLQIEMPKSKGHVFYSEKPIVDNNFSVNKVRFSRTPTEKVVEKGSPLFYALLPLTVIIDIVTAPVQLYMLTQVNRTTAGNKK